jgi:phosphatidylserine/phosphatidylglycerophosphate/cardiolipin synthase-like enzyme
MQPPEQVAELIASFLSGASQSLDVAIYDSGLTANLAGIIRDAYISARDRGVAIRVAYHADTERSGGVPPPSSNTQVFVESLGVPSRPVGSQQNLMHHKYVIRDAGTENGAVLTGSTNWGQDAWSREENVILQLFGPALANHYHADFEEVWAGDIEDSGRGAGGAAELSFEGQPMASDVWFAPADGRDMSGAVAEVIGSATRQIVIASPVITSGSILEALADAVKRQTVPVRGIVDRTQMEEVQQQWGDNPQSGWKISAFDALARGAGMVGKRSTPWSPQAIHDYMHLKMLVIDDTVFTGSFNFSRSGEDNAENLLRLDSAPLAGVCTDFIDRLIAKYADTPAVGPGSE